MIFFICILRKKFLTIKHMPPSLNQIKRDNLPIDTSKTMFTISSILEKIYGYYPYKVPEEIMEKMQKETFFKIEGAIGEANITIQQNPDKNGVGIFEVVFEQTK